MSANILIDSALVVPWSLDLIQDEPYEYPFKADYLLGSKRLIYIAALHSSELESATFKLIKDSMENENIDLMVLEGFGHSLGISPEKMRKWAIKQRSERIYEGFETAYAISLVEQRNTPFTGCEPDDAAIYAEISELGYSGEDLLFYYFVQQSFQMNEAQSKVDSQILFEGLINSKRLPLSLKKEPTYLQFQEWYLRKNGSPFIPSLIDEEVPAPYENGKLFTQRISSAVCKIRDQFIVKRIEDSLNSFNTVMVVCGGSHWSTQKNALEKALGKPLFSDCKEV